MKTNTAVIVMALLWDIKRKGEKLKQQTVVSQSISGNLILRPHLFLFLFFLCSMPLFAQNKIAPVVKGIQIGQQMPEVVLENLSGYINAEGKALPTAKLSSFRGKFLILDFWATWCSPCIAMMPKMDSLQKQFQNELQFLAVTYQNTRDVRPFLTKLEKQHGKPFLIPQVFGDQTLHQLLPHIYLPHYVWIDPNGVVRAITDAKAINAKEIEAVLSKTTYQPLQKKDVRMRYDTNIPLFFNGNIGNVNSVAYNATLSNYVEGIGCGLTLSAPLSGKQGFSKILVRNLGIVNLFSTAIGAGKKLYVNSRILLETRDSLHLSPSKMGQNWQQYAWCYDLKLPPALQRNGYELMYADLSRLFNQYSVKLEKRMMTCYALQKIDDQAIPVSAKEQLLIKQDQTGFQMKNGSLELFVNTLEVYYYYDAAIPIINMANYTGQVDLEIDAPLNDIEAVNIALRKYGLTFVKDKFEIDMIVFKDAVN